MQPDRQVLSRAKRHLQRRDPALGLAIRQIGPCELVVRRGRFQTLAYAIVAQQISVAAARTIRGRLAETLGGRITAEGLAQLTAEQYRQAGVSRQKASYLKDLGQQVCDRSLRLERLSRLDDEAVVDALCQVKGIGRWTAQMFLIFTLGRLNVFPADDLGVRNGLRRIHGLKTTPQPSEASELSQNWAPYRSVGSWYCWKILEHGESQITDAD